MSASSMPDAVEVPLVTDAFFDNELGPWHRSLSSVGRRRFLDPIDHNGGVGVSNQQLTAFSFGCFQTVARLDLGDVTGELRFTFDFERETGGADVHDTRAFITEDGAELDPDVLEDTSSPNTFFPPGRGLSEGTVTLSAEVDGSVAVGFVIEPRQLDATFCSLGSANRTELRVDTVETSIVVEDPVDTDGDGLPDSIENGGIPLGNGTVVTPDPTDPDSDGDGLEDGEEILVDQFVTHPDHDVQYYLLNSDPTRADSSGLGVSDYTERAMGVDPLSPNTDGDRFTDIRDYNPLDGAFEPDRLTNEEQLQALVHGAVLGDAGAEGSVAESPYNDTREFLIGQIIGTSIPIRGSNLVALRDAAGQLSQGKPLSAALTAAGIVPVVSKVADTVSLIKDFFENFVTKPSRQLEALKDLNRLGVLDPIPSTLVRRIIRSTKWVSADYDVLADPSTDDVEDALDLIETIPRAVSPANVGRGFTGAVGNRFFLMTGDRYAYVRGRHVTGTVGRDRITAFFPTGVTIPAGADRPSRTLPNRMTESDVTDVILAAIRSTSGSDTEIIYDPRTDGFGFGITQLKVIVNPGTGSIVHAYPQTGPAVERWTGDAFVTDPDPFP